MPTFTKLVDMRRGPFAETCDETYPSPWGTGRVVTAEGLPLLVELPRRGVRLLADGRPPSRWAALLERYFAGDDVVFDLDVDRYAEMTGLTDFERAVVRSLSAVARGIVVSYRDLAVSAGRPDAYRAVGSVMARNQLPIILPCHRVVRNDGGLGGYGDDPSWKSRLLALEGVRVRGGRIA